MSGAPPYPTPQDFRDNTPAAKAYTSYVANKIVARDASPSSPPKPAPAPPPPAPAPSKSVLGQLSDTIGPEAVGGALVDGAQGVSAAASTVVGGGPLDSLTAPFTAIAHFFVGDPARPGSHGLSWLLLPSSWVRIVAGIFGAVVLFAGVTTLIKEAKE